MKMMVEVDADSLDEVFLKELRVAYIDQCTVWKHQDYSKKLRKALLKVIEYYSIPSEHTLWLETVKDL